MRAYPLSELAELLEARLTGDSAYVVRGPATLTEAGPGEISFLAHPAYKGQLETTRAGAVVVAEDVETGRDDLNVLRVADPGRAFSRVILAFAEEDPEPEPGVHPSAVLAPGAEVHPESTVGPLCTVESGAKVGAGSVLVARVHVGHCARIGQRSVLHPGVVLYPRVEVGDDCIVHGGAVVGADGFGFEPTPGGWEKTPQCGTVVIEDEVEIGANVTIDRGRFGATRIQAGAKLDNLVHLGHNVQVGRAAMLVAQTGVAGSSRIGERAILAGQAGISGHIVVGDGARVGGSSAVFKDVPNGQDVFGVPAGPEGPSSLRIQAWLAASLGGLLERVRALHGARGPARRRRDLARGPDRGPRVSRQRTLRTAVEFEGVGLHSGETVTNVRLLPAAPGDRGRVRAGRPGGRARPFPPTSPTTRRRSAGPVSRGAAPRSRRSSTSSPACSGLQVDNVMVETERVPRCPASTAARSQFVELFKQGGHRSSSATRRKHVQARPSPCTCARARRPWSRCPPTRTRLSSPVRGLASRSPGSVAAPSRP